MTHSPAFSPIHASLRALFAAAVLMSAHSASADCSADSECPKGFTCQQAGVSGCTAPACAPDQDCTALPPCDPVIYKECAPGPCNTDSDCASDMVCFSRPETSCATSNGTSSSSSGSGSAGAANGGSAPSGAGAPNMAPTSPSPEPCPAGQKCDPYTPPVCATTTVKECTPRYVLPCMTDTDCGAGFACVPEQTCECSGGGGAADAGAAFGGGQSGSAPPPTPAPAPSQGSGAPAPEPVPVPPPACSCTNSSVNYCQAKIVDCTTDSNCPAGWSCASPAVATPGCAEPARVGDAGAPTPVCDPPPPPPKQCVPPYAQYGYSNGSSAGFGSSGGAPLGSAPETGVDQGTGTGTTGSAGATGGGVPTGAPSDPMAPAAGHSATPSSNASGGCSVGHTAPTSGAAFLSIFGLLGLVRRRRSRAA